MKKILITVFAIGIALTSFSQKGFEKGNMYNSFSLGYQGFIPVGTGFGFGLGGRFLGD